MKNLTFLIVLLVNSFCFAGDKVELYKDKQLKEINVHEKIVYRTMPDGQKTKLKINVGEAEGGKISSYLIEVVESDLKVKDVINIEAATKQIVDFIAYYRVSIAGPGSGGPADIKTSCFTNCNKKWDCANQPSEVGAGLCASDCFIECYMISKPTTSISASLQ